MLLNHNLACHLKLYFSSYHKAGFYFSEALWHQNNTVPNTIKEDFEKFRVNFKNEVNQGGKKDLI